VCCKLLLLSLLLLSLLHLLLLHLLLHRTVLLLLHLLLHGLLCVHLLVHLQSRHVLLRLLLEELCDYSLCGTPAIPLIKLEC